MVFPLPVGLPLSVYENVAYAPRRAGIHDRGELDALVETCLRQAMLWDEVKDRLDMLGTRLSGGQQQRLTLARALSHRPEILCLDEFSIAIDPVTTMKIEDVLLELKERDDDRAGDEPRAAGPPAGRSHRILQRRPADRGGRDGDASSPGPPTALPSVTSTEISADVQAQTADNRGIPCGLQTRDLNLWYGRFQALRDITL